MDMSLDQRMQFCMEVFAILFSQDLVDIFVFDPDTESIMYEAVIAKRLDPKWEPWVVQQDFRCFKDASMGLRSLPVLDVTLDLTIGQPTTHNYNPVTFRFLTQNPNKPNSQYARLASIGHKIMWIIKKGETDEFVGRIQDGEFIQNQPRAYQPANPKTVQDDHGADYTQYNGDWERQLNEVPEISFSGIPQHVLDELS